MKIKRSTKHTLKFATKHKLAQLNLIRGEYLRVVNLYIDLFWLKDMNKRQLTSDILNQFDSWFTQRMKQQTAREAIDMCNASLRKSEELGEEAIKPIHSGNRMCLSSAICTLETSETDEFDMWLKFRSIGNKMKLDIPIKLHRQYYKWNEIGRRLNSFVILKDSIQFSFEIETGVKKPITNCIGVDTGINALASLSNDEQTGTEIKGLIEIIKRRKHGSKGQKRAISTLKSYISITAKQLAESDISLVVVEDLKNITRNTKLKGRLSKNMRSSIGKWNVSYWLMRLEQKCEENRVSFRRVQPYFTSQTCSVCGSVDRRNRNGEEFLCLECGHEANADVNAAKNILDRFLTGKYGSGYKTEGALLFC